MMSTLSQTLGAVPVMTDNGSRHVQRPGTAPNLRADAESSLTLVQRARTGDDAACNELCARYLPRLTRWAHGRLPASARDALETTDLVQDTFLQVLRNLDAFEPRHPGAFQGYLRRTLINRIRDEIRRVQRRGVHEALDAEPPATDPSPLEAAVGRETLDVYEAALERLKDSDREAAIMRIELGFDYAEIMEALGKPTIAATQMAVRRALLRLAEEMSCVRPR
jgi:RNA polymerase sigma-70 factor (ECF subfamily)